MVSRDLVWFRATQLVKCRVKLQTKTELLRRWKNERWKNKNGPFIFGQQGRKQYCLQISLTTITTRAPIIRGILYSCTFKINKCLQHSPESVIKELTHSLQTGLRNWCPTPPGPEPRARADSLAANACRLRLSPLVSWSSSPLIAH